MMTKWRLEQWWVGLILWGLIALGWAVGRVWEWLTRFF